VACNRSARLRHKRCSRATRPARPKLSGARSTYNEMRDTGYAMRDSNQPSSRIPNRASRIFALIAIGVAVLVSYAPALRDGFVWDDTALVQRDPLIRSWRLIPEAFNHF